jgi:prevent-host-death family protein
MTVTATEFKARCLAIIDQVHTTGETVIITKRGRVVAKLVAERNETDRPWLALRGSVVRWDGDPLAPAVDEDDIEALK